VSDLGRSDTMFERLRTGLLSGPGR
jgi:hypothetical protein